MKESITEKTEQLLKQYPFEALSKSEQALILHELTIEEYQAYHRLATHAKILADSDENLAPPPLNNIKKVLGNKLVKEPSLVEKINAIRIPVWLIGVLALVGYGLVQLLQGNEKMAEPAFVPEVVKVQVLDTVYVHSVDTVYKYKEIIAEPIVITKEVIKIKEVFVQQKPPLANTKNIPLNIPADQVAYYSNAETPDLLVKKPGRSISTDSELMELLDKE